MNKTGLPALVRVLWTALLASACTVPGAARLAPPPDLPAEQATTRLTDVALDRTWRMYLYPERLNRQMLIGALDSLEQRFDSVRFTSEPDADQGILWIGQDSVRVPLAADLDAAGLEDVLGRVLSWVKPRLPADFATEDDSNIEVVALRGALLALDRYSTVYSGDDTEDFQIRFSGRLVGIGARIGRQDGNLVASEVFPDSPAERGGLKSGDAILYVDGAPTRPLSVRDAVDRIRGQSDTQVRLTVLRAEGEAKRTFDVQITRGEVSIPSVSARMLRDGIGYAQIRQVSKDTDREFRERVDDLGPLRGLVMDLRGNTGGSMDAARKLADFFLASDTILKIVGRGGEPMGGERSQQDATPQVQFAMPVVVLIDAMSASAAEIIAGAIEPLPNVQLMGQRTFGKGLIQRVVPLPNANLLKLTVGEYLLSGDRAIHTKGIDPDIALYPVETDNLGELAARPENALAYLRKPDEDDNFPIELAANVLERGADAALPEARSAQHAQIAAAVETHGITWNDEAPHETLASNLRVEQGVVTLTGGTPGQLELRVTNPNTVPVPAVWAALEGPEYLANKLVSFGTLAPGQTATGKVMVDPPDGLAVASLALTARLSSGEHPLQSEKVWFHFANHTPELEIEVTKSSANEVKVRVANRGCCNVAGVRVGFPGAVKNLENLAPGAEQTVDLPVAGDSPRVAVLLAGAGAAQTIEIPIPAERVLVVPPAFELERSRFMGREQLRVHVKSSEGLAEGWISLDGQKEVYAAWQGEHAGLLEATPAKGEYSLTTKIETPSGVSLIDSRQLTIE